MRKVKIATMADKQGYIADQVFEDVEIVGPAVLAPAGRFDIERCTFPGPIERFAWVAPVNPIMGPIGIRNCTFRDCRFHSTIGIAGDEEFIRRIITDLLDSGSTG
jgi:hypothetical protein